MHALHPARFPQQWKMPGRLKEHNYPPTNVDNMMSSQDVVETRSVQCPKLRSEYNFFNYAAQYTHICELHKCDHSYYVDEFQLIDKGND